MLIDKAVFRLLHLHFFKDETYGLTDKLMIDTDIGSSS